MKYLSAALLLIFSSISSASYYNAELIVEEGAEFNEYLFPDSNHGVFFFKDRYSPCSLSLNFELGNRDVYEHFSKKDSSFVSKQRISFLPTLNSFFQLVEDRECLVYEPGRYQQDDEEASCNKFGKLLGYRKFADLKFSTYFQKGLTATIACGSYVKSETLPELLPMQLFPINLVSESLGANVSFRDIPEDNDNNR